eukprot:m.461851 g.461851  ORF g.461851 m.461851 type:complete len:142 (-) comp22434_c0_seq1:119-544(-)
MAVSFDTVDVTVVAVVSAVAVVAICVLCWCLTPKDDLTPLTPVTPVSTTTTTSWHRMEETPLLDPTTILPANPPATPASPQAFEVEMSRISLEVALGGAATDDDDWTRTSVFTAKSLFCRGCGQPKTTGMRFCTACGEENP